MKRFIKPILLSLALLLILLIQPLPGAITKTTSIVEVDAWQLVAPGTLVVGNNHDISGSYQTKVYFESAYTDPENSAQDGVDVLVEISYADDNWVLHHRFTTTGDATASTTLDGQANATEDTITLADATTGDFDVPARKWFILDGTVANSESVKTELEDGFDNIDITQDLIRTHATGLTCYDFVFEDVIAIPMAAAQVRVLINNVDADATIHFTTRVSKVTGI